jgi:DHA2 family multidrug resistance protein-like MFS transporter
VTTQSWMTSGEGHPRRWGILAALVVSLLVVVLDNTILNIALPTIQRDLGATQSQLVWSIDAYILVFASLLFTWGILGDKYGRKKILVIGLVIFGIASAACAFAASPGMLIAFRALMGVGGAAVMPTTLAIITVVFPPHERGKAIGAWAGAVGAAVALGPVLGGILLEHPEWSNWATGNDWGSVFLINVPIVIVGLFFIIRIVPETRNPHPRKLDLTGLVISATGLVLLIYGIINASTTKNWLAPSVLIPMTLGILILAAFLWMESRSDHASFDVSLFANRGYAVSLTAVSLAFFAMSGITFSLPFYLQILRGYSTLQAGLCFLPFAIGQIIAAPRSAGMVKRFGYKKVMTGGLILVALAMLMLAMVPLDAPLWAVLTVFFVFGFGMGNVIAPGSTVMQNVLPLARAGAGSAVQNTVRQVAGALGVAIVGTVLANQYAANLSSVLDKVPPQFPGEAKAAASESIVAADQILNQAVAQGAPVAVIEPLRQGAYEAFLNASHVTSFISLAVIVIAGLAVFFLLPPITPPEKGDLAVGAVPKDATDALVLDEIAHYKEEAAEEYGVAPESSREE